MLDPYLDDLRDCKDASMVANCLLQKSVSFSGAPMGNVQFLDLSGRALTIAAQTGFEDEFLNAFRQVDAEEASVCGQALKRREAVSVPDVTKARELSPYQSVFAKAKVRAVRSVPLVSRVGSLEGMVSVHFSERHEFELAELVTLTRFATLAADRLVTISSPSVPRRHRPSKENRAVWEKLGLDHRQ